MNGTQYTSLNAVEDYTFSPWAEQVALNGTDGLQFSLKLSSDDSLFTFAPDLNRNLEFTYKSTNTSYDSVETYMYYLDAACLESSEATANFDIVIDGISNLTTTLRASAIAAKGHYYGLSADASYAVPKIVDSTGSVIEASAEYDDTYLGVESYTGVTLISKERLFFNMVLQNDDLFQDFGPSKSTSKSEYGYFFPLAYRSREMVWSEAQVEDTFGALIVL